MDALAPLNESLKRRGVRLTVERVKNGLYVRGMLPQPDGSRKQDRKSLGLKAVDASMLEAETRAIALASAINAGTYPASGLPWAQVTGCLVAQPASTARTVAEWTVEFERDFWQGKVRNSAAESTLNRLLNEIQRLPTGATLTTDLLVAEAGRTAAGSRSRLESCKVYKRLAKLGGLQGLERLDNLRTTYEPAERNLPTDEQLLALLERTRSHQKYGWLTAALVVYGCRPAEAYSLQPAADGTARVLTVKRKGKLPTWRTAMALPSEWVERFDLATVATPLAVRAPSEYDSHAAKRLSQAWGKWLKRQLDGLQLYSCRHAWAVRSSRVGLNASLAAKTLGHSLTVHHDTYHRWLEQADVAAAAAALAKT